VRRLFIAFGAVGMVVTMPAVARETKTVTAYCMVGPEPKIATSALTVTVKVDTSSRDSYRISTYISEAIGWQVSDALYQMGINTNGNIACNFTDPTLSYDPNENRSLSQLQDEIARLPGYGYRMVTVDLSRRASVAQSQSEVSSPTPARKEASEPGTGTAPRVRRDNPLGKTPNQVKYELATAVHQAQLAKLAKEKAEVEAKKEQQRAAARQVLSQHDQALARHREVVAASERQQAEYRAKLAAPQAKLPEGNIAFREGVVLCQKRPAPSKEWRCPGPLQVTYANLDDLPRAMVSLGQACGSGKSIRDLGMVSGYRAFGCGFGIHPTARDYPGNTDVPAQLGVGYVPGRATFYCPRSKLAYCR
jgi:conjugal transfer/entry exclusion protein